ncbi:hypothetical protein [Myxococcus sp. RHSTA-1-4]|uniref:hypothetical protein n=1 Tax=Myxococcus sp. RHSTA-1-4 TaxID=2874601 RepID=UPI001CC0FC1B|nr:hypothetical protein [Myxococcus sp. RHSTA-1-4]MBZ4418716.1 hypothetical protein [Myxococcus sp. RHSTA-1-4]
MSMQAQLLRYFAEEKAESLLFVLAGVVALAASVWLWRTGSSYRAMAFPLVAVALIHLVVGGSVYLRTDVQVAALTAQLAQAPAAFQSAELARMGVVMRNFALYKLIELGLLAAGIAMTYAFRHREALYAVGIGLVIQAGVTLVADLFAEKRGDTYLAAVRSLSPGVTASASTPPPVLGPAR